MVRLPEAQGVNEADGPLERAPSLASLVYEELLQDIVLERFDDGQKLPSESALCERFAVSRPVLREALLRLKSDNLLVTRQGSGSFVRKPRKITLQAGASMNAADVIRGLEFRMGVEPEAAYRAAQRRNENDVTAIEAALEAFESASSKNESGVHLDFRFHLAIAIASHNDLFASSLWRIHRTIGHELDVLNLAARKSTLRKDEVKTEHRQIWDAIRFGDPDRAAEISRKHVEIGLKRILEMTQKTNGGSYK